MLKKKADAFQDGSGDKTNSSYSRKDAYERSWAGEAPSERDKDNLF